MLGRYHLSGIILPSGHKAYLGFMYLDHTYNNAVVHVFVGLLKCCLGEHLRESTHSLHSQEEGERRTVSCSSECSSYS